MFAAIHKDKIVQYEPMVRDYGILCGRNSIRMLSFCAWCGTKLPESLHSKIFDVTEHELGIPRYEADFENYANLPDEFKTDEWWRKRGL